MIELLANRLGSIITAISVSTGAVAAEYDYQAYGARVETATLDQPYGFTGREHDSESGLMHYRARAYDPETGLFLQVDPIEFFGGGLGLFRYTNNNPTNRLDPDGFRTRTLGGTPSGETVALIAANAGLTVGVIGEVYGGLISGPLTAIMDALNNPIVFSKSDSGDTTGTGPSGDGNNCKAPRPPNDDWREKLRQELIKFVIPFMEAVGLLTELPETFGIQDLTKQDSVPELLEDLTNLPQKSQDEYEEEMKKWQEDDDDC